MWNTWDPGEGKHNETTGQLMLIVLFRLRLFAKKKKENVCLRIKIRSWSQFPAVVIHRVSPWRKGMLSLTGFFGFGWKQQEAGVTPLALVSYLLLRAGRRWHPFWFHARLLRASWMLLRFVLSMVVNSVWWSESCFKKQQQKNRHMLQIWCGGFIFLSWSRLLFRRLSCSLCTGNRIWNSYTVNNNIFYLQQ